MGVGVAKCHIHVLTIWLMSSPVCCALGRVSADNDTLVMRLPLKEIQGSYSIST